MTTAPARRPRGVLALVALYVLFAALFAGLIALGSWQVQRRAWKLDLIQRVEARVHAPPGAPPARTDWSTVSAARDEYRHVRLSGRYLPGRDTYTQAVTELGPGYWLLSPFRTEGGEIVLVNRGFVRERRPAAPSSAGEVTGLLRLSEPGGGFLRRNAPAQERWHSRDVAAIAAARGLDGAAVAPYFVDADRTPGADAGPAQEPVGGLTVIKFPNNHLVYALTWFGLALMVAGAAWRVALEQRRRRRAAPPPTDEVR
ncbi:SURF1 family protein [Lysobacter antibioticus]|uniref:SURF1 family protein n=1 Tax=Lysobacter antibioticus TaxID=84531 RepID=UPI0003495292|nr:SURF1 family protein [Lysobacter antibioticus]